MKIAINSQTTGQYNSQKLNGRDHIVTKMTPIIGNTVMNGGLYPDAEVDKSFTQLNMLPAPDGHPKVGGHHVSAFHPLATNAHNIGGIIRNPSKTNKIVTAELWIDMEVANSTAGGKELLKRIKNKEKVGVSTGLTLKQRAANGVGDDGKDYSWEGADFKFDHVAILLNEAAAGDHVGTELKFNAEELDIVQLNELTASDITQQLNALVRESDGQGDYSWVRELFPESKKVVYRSESRGNAEKLFQQSYAVDSNDIVSLLDDKTEVIRKITFEPVGGTTNNNSESESMAKEKVNVEADPNKSAENKQSPEEKADVAANANDVQSAVELLEAKGFVINKADEAKKINYLLGNHDRIKAMLEKDDARLQTIRDEIIANSDFSEDDLKGQSEDFLVNLRLKCLPANYTGNNGGSVREANSEDDHLSGGYGADAVENSMKDKEAA